ncbi:MAG TPA: class I SAM-dependent methyltransferase, partial [Actinomycetes bacterium]
MSIRAANWKVERLDAASMTAMEASRTAVLVCQGRAAADGRIAVGRFADPVAITMLRDAERVPVDQVRAGMPPADWAERVDYEAVRACAELMVPRTIAIDEAVRARPAPQVVILGAGLDARAWRMKELAGADVFEVDRPPSQHEKQDRIGDQVPVARSLRYVPVDFTRDRLDAALAEAGHQPSAPTTWIWEGVVPYLHRPAVAATVAVVSALSAPGSNLIVNYQSRSVLAALGRIVARAMNASARRRSPWADEPRRSAWTPETMRRLLTSYGFTVTSDDDLLGLARRLPSPVHRRISMRTGRIAVTT